ncbi:MAG TPA: hypothetical protein VJB05_03885 [archaeon]|nr:hypothetical protein [archaeon]
MDHRKHHVDHLLPIALFLIGIVMLMESAATMFVLTESPLATSMAWIYVMLKSLVSIFVIFAGYVTMKK